MPGTWEDPAEVAGRGMALGHLPMTVSFPCECTDFEHCHQERLVPKAKASRSPRTPRGERRMCFSSLGFTSYIVALESFACLLLFNSSANRGSPHCSPPNEDRDWNPPSQPSISLGRASLHGEKRDVTATVSCGPIFPSASPQKGSGAECRGPEQGASPAQWTAEHTEGGVCLSLHVPLFIRK